MPTVPAKSYPISHPSIIAVDTTPLPLVAANPDRAAVMVQNVGTVDVFISGDPAVASSGAKQGWKLPGSMPSPAEYVNPWGKGPLYVVAAGAGGSVAVDDSYPE